jgi:hypothetical protein
VITHFLLRRYTLLKNSTILWVSGAVGLIGGLPDILSLPETIRGEYGPTYVFWHDFSGWSFVPPIGMHQIVDWITHTPGGGWAWFAYPLEAVSAAAIVYYVWYAVWGELWAWITASLFAATWLAGLIVFLLR